MEPLLPAAERSSGPLTSRRDSVGGLVNVAIGVFARQGITAPQ
jgi:hypothetical protein